MKTSLVDNEAKTNFPLTNSSNAIGIGLEPMTDSDIAHEYIVDTDPNNPLMPDGSPKTLDYRMNTFSLAGYGAKKIQDAFKIHMGDAGLPTEGGQRTLASLSLSYYDT